MKIYICCNLWFSKFTPCLGRWNLPQVKHHWSMTKKWLKKQVQVCTMQRHALPKQLWTLTCLYSGIKVHKTCLKLLVISCQHHHWPSSTKEMSFPRLLYFSPLNGFSTLKMAYQW